MLQTAAGCKAQALPSKALPLKASQRQWAAELGPTLLSKRLGELVLGAYLVEGRHGRGAHRQGYADDRVAVEAICVGHHHDPSDGEDGSHYLDQGRKWWSG